MPELKFLQIIKIQMHKIKGFKLVEGANELWNLRKWLNYKLKKKRKKFKNNCVKVHFSKFAGQK